MSVLDVDWGVSEGSKVVTWDQTGTKWQRWIVDMDLALKGIPSVFQSLDYDGGKIKVLDEAVYSNDHNVVVWGVTGGNNQKWFFPQVSQGRYQLVNEYSKRCIVPNGRANQVITQICNVNEQKQLWTIDNLTEPKEVWKEHWWEHTDTLKILKNYQNLMVKTNQ